MTNALPAWGDLLTTSNHGWRPSG